MSVNVEELLLYILPHLEVAGRYTLQIQDRIESQEIKGIGTNFADALTDGDLSVQNYIEVALLARFPELSFYGEEFQSSLNTKYFRGSDQLTVILDPIDGTLLFKDGLKFFSIILGVLNNGEFEGALCLIPGSRVAYAGIRGKGVFQIMLDTGTGRENWERYTLPECSGRGSGLIHVYNEPEIAECLKQAGFSVVDPAVDYPSDDWWLTTHSVLTGELASTVATNAQAIDSGALGFLASEAGGITTNFEGGKFGPADSEFMCGPMVSSSDRRFHEEILAALKN